ncbi:hypothetical protein SAMN02745724_02682 [Pseudoalteromonas denitrificans DSM 6059]|uniref:Uncharacterized protein n=1 Tax=Pseudoalteromonas denitrificans DSM 6059 TaxID=1123010 RepID=A0A1I1MEU1_9GAMM|nr:hypothetical protein SAMN02745724_02682 [Pseudoalteromonas denitrificans DSM 6059]
MFSLSVFEWCGVIFNFIYILLFALFGMSATYFVRFFYDFWFKNKMEISYIIKAGVCTVLSVICYGVIIFL